MRSSLRKPTIQVDPYAQLAHIYDHVMSHVDYKMWAKYIDKLFNWSGTCPNEILDISCGTGSLDWFLVGMGYRMALFDMSMPMVKAAKQKFQKAGCTIPIWVSDMRAFTISNPVQGVICSYDSMNYLLTKNDWDQALQNVLSSLCKGGIFIFDICTEFNSLTNFNNYKDQDGGPGFFFTRQSTYSVRDKIQTNEFRIKLYTNHQQSYRELHKQKIFSLSEVKTMVEANKLKILGIFEDFTLHVAGERSERVHFVLQK